MLHLRREMSQMTQNRAEQTDFIIISGPAREVREVFVFHLAAEHFCPEDIASIPPLPSLATARFFKSEVNAM